MKIHITSPMVEAFIAGTGTYTPVFDGGELETENGSAAVSERNLAKIVNPNRRVVSFFLRHRYVLVSFDTGDSYLATGFSYHGRSSRVKAFAKFAAKHAQFAAAYELDSYDQMLELVAGLNEDYVGPLPIEPPHDYRLPDRGNPEEDTTTQRTSWQSEQNS
jgi:hypothetical protein